MYFEFISYSIIIGHHLKIEEIKQNIIDYAKIDVPVLIIGDPGTGKELVARRIHFESNLVNKPFTKISCTEIKPEVIESEIFGHKKGSFTDTDADKVENQSVYIESSIV